MVGVVKPGLAGDTLSLTQTGGAGVLNLGTVQADGSQSVIYSAPTLVASSALDAVSYTVTDQHNAAASGSASVQLDAGPAVTAASPAGVEAGQTTAIGVVRPGLAGDSLNLIQTGGTGVLSLGAMQADGSQAVIYTAPASIAASALNAVSYTVTDQHTTPSHPAWLPCNSMPDQR